MFSIDQRRAMVSLPGAVSLVPRTGMLANTVTFQTGREGVGLPQTQTGTGRTLGQLSTSYPDHCTYHTVSRAQQAAWGVNTPTILTAGYRFNPTSQFQSQQYAFSPVSVNPSQQYPPANFYDFVQDPKPTQSYIGLIAIAILSSPEKKLVLSDIYKYIMEHYAYFRSRGHGWRNSIRHNLSLNECFVKANRSSNGKGHFWAIHPANVDDFEKGDFRRRRAQRKVRKYTSRQKLKACNSSEREEPDTFIDVEMTEEEGCETPDDITQNDTKELWVKQNGKKGVSTEGQKHLEKPRSAFDIDTILSSTFRCVRGQIQETEIAQNDFEDKAYKEENVCLVKT